MSYHYDVAIIGSGAGGGTLAWGLARLGLRTLLVEKGQHLPQEDDNWSDAGALGMKYFKPISVYHGDSLQREYEYPFVGGQTKVYGAALYRLREPDFSAVQHAEGVSPAWPIGYAELEPFYTQAEQLYRVHNIPANDPTEPPRVTGRNSPTLPQERRLAPLIASLQRSGVNVCSIPRGLDYGGNCVFCNTCDGYACRVNGKMDTETACIQPATRSGFVRLLTDATCEKLVVDDSGRRVTAAILRTADGEKKIQARCFVAACGVWETPALLLRSACSTHPSGLANRRGNVGRHLAGHNVGFLLATTWNKWTDIHQKSFAINDYYFCGPHGDYPLGVLQSTGRLPLWFGRRGFKRRLIRSIVERSFTAMIMNEVLPDANNRVSLAADGNIRIDYQPNNLAAFRELRNSMVSLFRKSSYWLVRCAKTPSSRTPWHSVGTARIGSDARDSVLDASSRAHDIDNLYVVDSSSLPTAGAVNTSLTVMALALRAAQNIARELPALG